MEQSTSRIIRNKLGLLNLADELHNVSRACRLMGVSRDTFYRYRAARDEGGIRIQVGTGKTKRDSNADNCLH
jgi:hypothetical protein